MKIIFSILLVAFLFCFSIKAQEFSTSSKKAISLYQEALSKMDIRDFNKALDILGDAVKVDKSFVEAWLLMADVYDYTGKYDKVVEACRKAVEVGGNSYPTTYYFLANALFRTGNYNDALENAEVFVDKRVYTPYQKKKIEKLIESCQFALNAIQHPVKFEPIELGPTVNSEYDEYWPSLSADEEVLMFNRLLYKDPKKKRTQGNIQEDIFFCEKDGNTWNTAKSIGMPINTTDNDGAPFLTADGMQLYFTRCSQLIGQGKCDIYVCNKLDSGWSAPRNIGAPVNTIYSEKQATLSSDGRTLYFASNRPGGKGDLDIWVSQMDDSGNWGNPVNIGDSINTPESEQSPFIHPDNQTFYFSSNGHVGMGDFDIYLSRKDSTGKWGKAVNLGYPINTNAEEIGLIVDAKASKAYFASSRIPDKGIDLYSFAIPQQIKPNPVSYLKGKIFDAESLEPLKASFELIDLTTGKTTTRSFSNEYNGSFLLCLPVNHEYALNVSRKDYLFYSENLVLDKEYDINKPVKKDIALQLIKPGKNVVLKNIFFETNSFHLKEQSKVELNKLYSFLKTNANVKVEISGHTDDVGTEESNQLLSENRAKAVVEHLINAGIAKERLVYKGYGEKVPVADNKTEEGKALNRRTEFKILP